MPFSRDILYHRHRLSHQQIDEFLSIKSSQEDVLDKIEQLETVKEFLRITDALNESGVKYIPLKGPVLSYRLYNDPTSRIFKDIDLLADEEEVDKTVGVLVHLGYESVYHIWPEDSKRKKLFLQHRKHFNLYHPEKEIVIELHWKLFTFQVINEKSEKLLVEKNLTEIEFSGRKFSVFSNEFELLFLVIHGGLHDWKRLKWLVDIDKMLLVTPIDYSKFLEITFLLKAGRMVELCNEMLKVYFPDGRLLPQNDSRVPPFLIKFAHAQIKQAKGVEYDSVPGFLRFYSSKMMAFPGIYYKLSILEYLLFMPEDMDKEWIPSNKWIYYIIGPLKKLKRRLKKN